MTRQDQESLRRRRLFLAWFIVIWDVIENTISVTQQLWQPSWRGLRGDKEPRQVHGYE